MEIKAKGKDITTFFYSVEGSCAHTQAQRTPNISAQHVSCPFFALSSGHLVVAPEQSIWLVSSYILSTQFSCSA